MPTIPWQYKTSTSRSLVAPLKHLFLMFIKSFSDVVWGERNLSLIVSNSFAFRTKNVANSMFLLQCTYFSSVTIFRRMSCCLRNTRCLWRHLFVTPSSQHTPPWKCMKSENTRWLQREIEDSNIVRYALYVLSMCLEIVTSINRFSRLGKHRIKATTLFRFNDMWISRVFTDWTTIDRLTTDKACVKHIS